MATKTLWTVAAAVGLVAAGVGVGYALGAHAGRAPEAPGEDAGEVVARFSGGELRMGDVRSRIRDEGPLLAAELATDGGRKGLVRRMLRERVLLAEARQRGYERDPQVRRQCEGALREAFLEREFEEPERQRPVTDAELAAYFERQRAQLSRPAQARVVHLFVAARAEDTARRAAQRQAAEVLLGEARAALARGPEALFALARRRSEHPRTRALGGELPPFSREQLASALGAEVAGRVFAADAPHGLIGDVVESAEGFHVLAVLERSEATAPTLAESRDVLRPRYLRERREQALEAFLSGLEQAAEARVDEAAVSAATP